MMAGLAGMFLSAFLAATILPLGSEVVLGGLLAGGHGPAQVVAVATLGNVLGSVVNYGMGLWGGHWLLSRVCRVSRGDIDRAQTRFQAWGRAGLLLAWVPVIGDPLTVVAGMLRVNILVFILLVTAGKLGRYLVLAGALAWF